MGGVLACWDCLPASDGTPSGQRCSAAAGGVDGSGLAHERAADNGRGQVADSWRAAGGSWRAAGAGYGDGQSAGQLRRRAEGNGQRAGGRGGGQRAPGGGYSGGQSAGYRAGTGYGAAADGGELWRTGR